MKLIFIPFAGSLGFDYMKWKQVLAPLVTCTGAIYPGRGKRSSEPLAASWELLLDDVYEQVCKMIDDGEEYVLYAHSMGVPITYEIYYRLEAEGKRLPNRIFFSGNDIPPVCNRKQRSHLNDEDFRQYFVDLGGISEEVLACDELVSMLFELLRADINILESYVYEPKAFPVKCEVSVLNGRADDIISTADDWREILGTKVDFKMFDGGHFFIFSNQDEVLAYIKSVL